MIGIPGRLAWWRDVPGGAEWLEQLPRLVGECAEQWELELGGPFAHGNVSLSLAARRADGTLAVLKLNFPERETEHEADVLALWGGRGAVLLLAGDSERGALLLERALPGDPLWEVVDDEEATAIAASVLRRIWQEPPANHPFRIVEDEAEARMIQLRRDWEGLGRPFEERLVEAGEEAARQLARTQSDLVVCHQDFQGSNVLRAEREPWLAIDPKPIVGEPAFDVASLLRDRRWDVRVDVIGRRLDLLNAELGLDRERMRGWGIVHALYWGVGSTNIEEDMVECARILAAL